MSIDSSPMPPGERRRALAWGHVNGGLWAAGNALTTGALVVYLARDLGAAGLGLSLVLATPNLAGLSRLLAPAIIYRAGTARRACLRLLLASYVLILGLPAIATAASSLTRSGAVAAMIALLFCHQLLEYLGTVALWSWWGDLVPEPIRGRYFARRQRIQLAVSIPTLLASGYFADGWRQQFHDQPDRLLLAYAIPTGLGALLLLASVVPLRWMPATRRYPAPNWKNVTATIRAPFVDRRFWGLLIFRGWFSLANGVSQVVQNAFFPKDVLGFGVAPLSAMRVVTQVGQFTGARVVGKWSDRYGNRPVLVVAQLCVSLALVFYIVARPETRWLLVGAWMLFAAYVAHNICLPNLTLRLSPVMERPGYVAAGEAIGSVLHAGSTIAGGLLFDYLQAATPTGEFRLYRNCLILLGIGLAMRLMGVVLVARIREPNAWTWAEIWAGQRIEVQGHD
jgi:MFS family permease